MNIKRIGTLAMVLIVLLSMVSIASADSDHHHKAKFYVGKSHYHSDQNVKFTLKNRDHESIFIPCDGTIDVIRKKTGVVTEVGWNLFGDGCSGYGDGGKFELEPKHKIKQYWDQTDENGDLVDRGTYKAYTDYIDSDDRTIRVKTHSFKLKN